MHCNKNNKTNTNELVSNNTLLPETARTPPRCPAVEEAQEQHSLQLLAAQLLNLNQHRFYHPSHYFYYWTLPQLLQPPQPCPAPGAGW